MVRVNCDRLSVNVQVKMFTSPYYGEGFPLGLTVSLLGCFKHEGALYKEVFPGKIEAHLSVTVKVRGSNSKWRAI